MQKITPNLWFNGNAAEAVAFYTSVFPAGRTTSTDYYPTEGLADFQLDRAGQELVVEFELGGQVFAAINAGPEFTFNPSTSFMVNFDASKDSGARDHLDDLWEKLIDGGQTLMALQEYPFSSRYGWVQDKYGLSWQLIFSDDGGDPRPFIIPSLMFGSVNNNRAREAIDYYMSVFSNSHIGVVAPYLEQTGPANADSLMFADFNLEGQWFAAMDSGVDQDFTFNEAVSFAVACRDQDEIDYLWSKLSHVPEAEQCGWCKDQFGVSWQIVPEAMNQLMSRPGAYQSMMSMKKIIIADF